MVVMHLINSSHLFCLAGVRYMAKREEERAHGYTLHLSVVQSRSISKMPD